MKFWIYCRVGVDEEKKNLHISSNPRVAFQPNSLPANEASA